MYETTVKRSQTIIPGSFIRWSGRYKKVAEVSQTFENLVFKFVDGSNCSVPYNAAVIVKLD